ncbi:hypothetical protein [Candidatus Aquicultor secundus]|nr:hypothetical protein [Candidatus Aquicultor secundus]NCO66473.1 hypothetical protein [Solirubrobacter sp.]
MIRMTVGAIFTDPSFVNRTGRRNMVRVIVEKSDGGFNAPYLQWGA